MAAKRSGTGKAGELRDQNRLTDYGVQCRWVKPSRWSTAKTGLSGVIADQEQELLKSSRWPDFCLGPATAKQPNLSILRNGLVFCNIASEGGR